MKIRNGFVSNSSSSSFILKVTDEIPTIFSVAEIMIKHRDWDNNIHGVTPDKNDIEKLNSLPIDPNINLKFNSCNYDTYITKEDDYYLITTCNNHQFYDVLDDFSVYRKEYYIKYGEDLYDIQTDRDYYILDLDAVGRQLSWDESDKYRCTTDKCYTGELYLISGDIICGRCGKKVEKR